MRESKKADVLVSGIESMVNLIHKATDEDTCTESVLKGAIGLLGDLGATYGSRMHQIFSQPYVVKLIQEGKEYEDMADLVNYTQSVVHQVLSGK